MNNKWFGGLAAATLLLMACNVSGFVQQSVPQAAPTAVRVQATDAPTVKPTSAPLPTTTDRNAAKSFPVLENRIVSIRTLEASAMRDKPVVEIKLWVWPDEVNTFKAAVPQLYIGEKNFGYWETFDKFGNPLSPPTTHELIFALTPEEFAQAVDGALVTVEYASEGWDFGPFNKSLLDAAKPPPSAVPIAMYNKITLRTVSSSSVLKGNPGVEITVWSVKRFPVRNELAVLRIGKKEFTRSRYPDNGDTHTLVFTLTKEEFDRTSDGDSVRVYYGLGGGNPNDPNQWDFGFLDKRVLGLE